MRKFLVMLIAVLMLVIAVAPVSAQGTIVDLAVATDDLSTLVAAVQAADPAIAAALSGPGPLTVFAPTNTAFANLANFFGFELEALVADRELLTQLLLYHVVEGRVLASQAVELAGSTVPTLLPGTALGITVNDSGQVVLNRVARVVAADVIASNGVVHVINQVIFPGLLRDRLAALADGATTTTEEATTEEATTEETTTEEATTEEATTEETTTEETDAEEAPADPTIVDIATGNPSFSILVDLILAADPAILETLSGPGNFTVFAPTNTAFEALFDSIGLTADDVISLGGAPLITPVLLYHVLGEELTASALMPLARAGDEVETLLGDGIALSFRAGLTLNETIRVTRINIEASNGIIHVIDGVLLPEVTIQVLRDLGLL